MYKIRSRRVRLQKPACSIFYYHFQKNFTVSLKKQPFRKNVIAEEELDCIVIDDIGNLGDSPRFVFIDEGYGGLIVVYDSGELSRNITQKKNQTFYNSLWMLIH